MVEKSNAHPYEPRDFHGAELFPGVEFPVGFVMVKGGTKLLELGLLQRRLALGERIGDRLAQRLDSRRPFLSLIGRHGTERLEQGRDAALLAEIFDPQRFQRGQPLGSGNALARLAFESVEIVHRRAC